MDQIRALRVSMVIVFLSVSLLSQIADENLRFPIHPVWNQGQELLSEWRGGVLLVLAWDHKASRSHEVVSLAAHLSDRYLADGLSVILHHERDDKEAPIAALRAGATRGTLLALGPLEGTAEKEQRLSVCLYGPDGSLASSDLPNGTSPVALERRIQELLAIRSEGFGTNKLSRSVRRSLYAYGDFARAEQQIAEARDLSASAEELRNLNLEVDAHFERALNQLRSLESAGRLHEAVTKWEDLSSRTWSDSKRRSALLKEFPRAPYFQDHLATTASFALDRTWQLPRWGANEAEHLLQLRKGYQSLDANHPVALRITLLINTFFPNRKI